MAISPKKIVASYNAFANPINKQIQNHLKRSNIPAFSIMLKKLTMDTYFYNYELIHKAIGNNIVHINNLVYDCLVDSISDSIYNGVNNTTDKIDTNIVGWWSKSTIVDMVRRTSTFCPGGDSESMYFVSYGFAEIDQETLDKLMAGDDENIKIMKFADFSPDTFNMVVNQIVFNVITVINNMVPMAWPTVNQTDDPKEKAINTFHEFMTDCIKDADDVENPTLHGFTRAITMYCTNVVANGGVQFDVVKEVLDKTEVNYWVDETKKSKSVVETVTQRYTLSTDKSVFIQVEIPMSLVKGWTNVPLQMITKTHRNEMVSKLNRLVIDFCNYVFAATA